MDMRRESQFNDRFATPLLNNINNKVTEFKVSEFNDKEPIMGDNKGIFTQIKPVKCDNLTVLTRSFQVYFTK